MPNTTVPAAAPGLPAIYQPFHPIGFGKHRPASRALQAAAQVAQTATVNAVLVALAVSSLTDGGARA